eukprot:16401721-Heterocapsa_arctica.AAC.1
MSACIAGRQANHQRCCRQQSVTALCASRRPLFTMVPPPVPPRLLVYPGRPLAAPGDRHSAHAARSKQNAFTSRPGHGPEG